jgi:2-hydroxy-3-oxopropionate reductase
MATVGFIGLGIMGSHMAAHLVDAGHSVIGYDLYQSAIDRFVEGGGQGASSIAQTVKDVDVVITMVPDSPDVESAALGPEGIYAHARPGILHIDCSTIRPDVSKTVAKVGAASGFRVIDAPVSGGEIGAIEATLSIMIGGSAEDVAKAMPILETVGKTVVHVGPNGAGQTVKAANQLIVAGTIQLVAEAIVFLEAHHVDMDPAIRVLSGGLAGNAVLERKAAKMLTRSFEPGFRIDLHHKDMGIVIAAAREAGVAIPMGALAAQLIGVVRSQGHGDLDHGALLALVDQMSGHSAP